MNLKEFFLETLFPPRCLGCEQALTESIKQRALCNTCLNTITINETLFCIICRARLAQDIRVCHKNTPLRLAPVGRYADDRLRNIIIRLKYHRRTVATRALTELIRRYFNHLAYDFSSYTVIPVPLHAKRERKRGFNQSLLIAEIVSQMLNLPLLSGELIKTKQTLIQAQTKNRKERIGNLVDCFQVQNPELLRNKPILLVDDVCTSGATLSEAARELKKAGARNIIGFVIAHTG